MLLLLFCKLAYSTFENRYLSKELFQSICEDYKWDKGLYTGVIINHQIEEIYSKFDIHLNSFRECERKLDCFKKDDTSEEKIHLENELKRVKHEMLELYNNLQEKHQGLDDIVVPEDPSVDHRAKTLEIEKKYSIYIELNEDQQFKIDPGYEKYLTKIRRESREKRDEVIAKYEKKLEDALLGL